MKCFNGRYTLKRQKCYCRILGIFEYKYLVFTKNHVGKLCLLSSYSDLGKAISGLKKDNAVRHILNVTALNKY